MRSLQDFFLYRPTGNLAIGRQDLPEFDQKSSTNRRLLSLHKSYKSPFENSNYVIDITNYQSLSQEKIEASKFEDKFDSLSGVYQFSDEKDVRQFLSRNKFLFSVLREIPEQIYKYFVNNPGLSLKVSYEPETLGYSELWVEIFTKLSAKEAMSILDKFDEKWWLENMDRVDGKLNITLKFV